MVVSTLNISDLFLCDIHLSFIAKEEIILDDFLQKELENLAYQSIKEQETLETENKIDIISFINDFNSKLK